MVRMVLSAYRFRGDASHPSDMSNFATYCHSHPHTAARGHPQR